MPDIIATTGSRGTRFLRFSGCKVDDPAGYRLQTILGIPGELRRYFPVEVVAYSIENEPPFPPAEFGCEIEVAVWREAGQTTVSFRDRYARHHMIVIARM